MNIMELNIEDYDTSVTFYVDKVCHEDDDLCTSEDEDGHILKVEDLHVGEFIRRLQRVCQLMSTPDLDSIGAMYMKCHLPALVVSAESDCSECGDFVIDSDEASFRIWRDSEPDIYDISGLWILVPGEYTSLNDIEFQISLDDILRMAKENMAAGKRNHEKDNECA